MIPFLPCRRSRVRVSSAAFDAETSIRGGVTPPRRATAAHALPTPTSSPEWCGVTRTNRIHAWTARIVLTAASIVALLLLTGPMPVATSSGQTMGTHATARHPRTRRAVASWYGPGLYDRANVACPGVGQLHTWTQGVASKTLPCGTRLLFLSTRGQWIPVTVIDRGPYVTGRSFDLTAATHARLGLTCGVCTVTYRNAPWA